MRIPTAILLLSPILAGATIRVSDGTPTDTQTQIDASVDGDQVIITNGNFTWSSGVSISGKGITLSGLGAGGFFARSVTALTIGTGSKVFTVASGLKITNSESVIAFATAGNGTLPERMEGTVTSYSGTTLTLDITTTAGSGTFHPWTIARPHTTKITRSTGSAVSITSDMSHNTYIERIFFQCDGSGAETARAISVDENGSTKIPVIRDCWFRQDNNLAIGKTTTRFLVHNCSFDSWFDYNYPGGKGVNTIAIGCNYVGTPGTFGYMWGRTNTFGANDPGGTNNMYLEDNWFVGLFLGCLDWADNAKGVARRNIFDQCCITVHGEDTGVDGTRHWEIYDNAFHSVNDLAALGYNMANGYVYCRGQSGVITSNYVDDIDVPAWSSVWEWRFQLQSIRKAGAGCYTAYPAGRQHGQDCCLAGVTNQITNAICIWSNAITGGADGNAFNHTQYDPDDCGNGQLQADYVVENRDYKTNQVMTGWVRFQYPHPLHILAAESPPPSVPARIGPGRSGSRFVRSAAPPLLVLWLGILTVRTLGKLMRK